MKKFLCVIISLVLLAGALVSCTEETFNENKPDENSMDGNRVAPKYEELDFSTVSDLSSVTETAEVTDYVIMDVNNFGKIVIRLFPEVAPQTVANFKSLVSEGFYDGLTFHRIISSFMIQGGDPEGNGTGGSETTIMGEFTSNNFQNNLHHIRGVISMARSNNPNSASSQFFIVHKTSQNNLDSLDGKYAAFGYVVYGMDVVDDIAECRTDYNDKPVVDVIINSVKFAKVSTSSNDIGNNTTDSDKNPSVTPPTNNDSTPDNGATDAPSFESIDLSMLTDFTATVSTEPTNYVRMRTTKGDMIIRLFPDVAPETVANFKKLVGEGFYNGLIFHRVISNFMIQGGDPQGNGFGGSGTTIKGEFSANGFENNLGHIRGVISMARSNNPDSASSQFFIVHKTSNSNSNSLDGNYASFGYVVHGQEVIDAIATTNTDYYDKPTTDVVMTSVEFVTISK